MIRFITLSLIIHLIFFYSLSRKGEVILEDPILSVSLVGHETRQNKAPRPQSKPIRSSIDSQTATPTPAVENDLPPTSTEANGGGSEYTAGNVSVKPRVLKSFKPVYPQEAKLARAEGPVKLSVLINTKGLVQEVRVLDGPGYGLNETALEALKKFVFSPAEKDGVKVAARIVFVYRFRLESR